MAINVKRTQASSGITLFELDENNDDMPILDLPATFDVDENIDIMPSDIIFEISDEEFELDVNMDIMPN